jgi:hypothetical protein
VAKIIRRGKYHTRVETSDGKYLVLDNHGVEIQVGQELGIEVPDIESGSELRLLRHGDPFPNLIDSIQK